MTRHRLDWFSLLSGLTLTGIAVVALTGIDWDLARWVGPAVLIGVGVLVLAAVLAPARGDARGTASTAPAPGPDGEHDERLLEDARAEVDAVDHGTA